MMKILIIFNSSFQLISGMHTVLNFFSNNKIDAVFTDRLADYNNLGKKFSKANIFKNIYSIKTKNRIWKNWQHTTFGFCYDSAIKKVFPEIDKGYDVFLFANISGVTTCLATYLHKHFGTKLFMYEDGFVAYSDYYKSMFNKAYCDLGITNLFLYLKEKRAIRYVTKYFVFCPELISDWNFNFDIIPVPKIDTNCFTVQILNRVFEYEKKHDDFQKLIVFFEESYFADGLEIGDINIVNKIASIVGKDNIIVKIHPRNTINRFQKEGYITNNDISVPWEIIALNQDLSNTFLVTISSGSSVTSYFITEGKAKRSIFLYEMEGIDRSKLTPSIAVFDKICKQNSYFVYPHNMKELQSILLEQKEGKI